MLFWMNISFIFYFDNFFTLECALLNLFYISLLFNIIIMILRDSFINVRTSLKKLDSSMKNILSWFFFIVLLDCNFIFCSIIFLTIWSKYFHLYPFKIKSSDYYFANFNVSLFTFRNEAIIVLLKMDYRIYAFK